LRDAGIDAAESQLLDLNGLRCLIIDRFDRIGEMGRRAVMTLAAASDQLHGTWTDSAEEMQRQRKLNDEGFHRIALLDAFGSLIANTDRHHYNISLFPTLSGYDVAPAFDQLPMAYAPPASGNLRNSAVEQSYAAANTLAVWDEAHALASEFWQRAAMLQLTNSMQKIVRAHARR
jgi:serine/threonine protein kinase HipA of HipAB toxin-antitoxin module